MAISYALLAAVFASLTSILAKIGLKNNNANLVTALRCIVVIICALILIFFRDVAGEIFTIESRVYLFLILSGLFTGASWLLYFNALKVGQVSQVAPIDSSSIVITILFSWFLLGEQVTTLKVLGVVLVFLGLFFIVWQKTANNKINSKALIYALLGSLAAAMSSITGKIGIVGVDSILGTAIRVFIVLIFSWLIVYFKKDYKDIKYITKKDSLFIVLSGLSTGLSWFAFYRALQLGDLNKVVAIDKMSIVFTMLFSVFILKEKLRALQIMGIIFLVIGVFLLI